MPATYYVSNAATNGYIVGVDTNDGTAKDAAVLTLEKAFTLVANGDTIRLNDGIYTAPTTPGYWSLTKSGIILSPENPLGVFLRSNETYAVRMFNINNAIAEVGIIANDIVFDGINVSQVGMYCNQTANMATLVFNECDFRNFVLTPIKNIHASGYMHVTLNRCKMNGANWQRGGVHMPNIVSGGLVVDGLEIDQNGRINAEGGVVFLHAIGAGVTYSAKNVTGISRLGATAPGNNFAGLLARNVKDAVMEDNDLDIIGVGAGSAAATLYEIAAHATGVQDSSNGRMLRCHGTNGTSAGKTCVIGSDVHDLATVNQHNYGLIEQCIVKGTELSTSIHGPMLGYGTGGKIQGCTTDHCGIGGLGLLKGMVSGIGPLAKPMSVGNRASHCAQSACYQKGSADAIHANNTLITSPGFAPTFELAAFDNSTVPNIMGSDGRFINNVVTGDTCPAYLGVQGTQADATDTTSGTLFYRTHIDTSLGDLANKWSNGATVYADLAAFNAALAAAGHDCVNADLRLDAGHAFTAYSEFLGIGYKFWGDGPRPIGSDGRPFSDWGLDIGSVQSSHGPLHPVNL